MHVLCKLRFHHPSLNANAGDETAETTGRFFGGTTNAIFMPFAEKLGYINKQELNAMEIIIRGVMAIQSGENPRVIQQKLNTFLPPKLRANREEAA